MIELEEIIICDDNECCICLCSECIDKSFIKMTCCNNFIHKECIFDILLFKHKHCPLCRKTINIKDYFTRKQFIKCINKLTFSKKLLYQKQIQKLFLQLIYHDSDDKILFYLSRILNFMYSTSFIYAFYIILFILSYIILILTILSASGYQIKK
jgi:hypothetical protein